MHVLYEVPDVIRKHIAQPFARAEQSVRRGILKVKSVMSVGIRLFMRWSKVKDTRILNPLPALVVGLKEG